MESLPSEKAQQNNSVVFTSIENRNDIMDELTQNIRPSLMDANTKRYSVPKNYKNSFYAIHHIPRIDSPTENTEPTPLTPPPPPLPPTTANKQKKSSNTAMSPTSRNRKRTTTEPAKNCKRSRSMNKVRKSSNSTQLETNNNNYNNNSNHPQLYQTCHSIWPENKTLGEYSYDNIKSLSNLLKVRLCQAKFKMMAKLDSDNELFTFLADEYVTPNHKLPCPIKLNKKRHKSSLSVVGNGKNLFRRKDVHLNHVDMPASAFTTASTAAAAATTTTVTTTTTTTTTPLTAAAPATTTTTTTAAPAPPPPTTTTTPPPTAAASILATTAKKKKKMTRNPPTTVVKTTRRSKKRSAAADIPPVTLSDGSTVYVCEPCHKKYKNRNGLGYHLQRCKYRVKEESEEGSNNSEESVINCICTQNTDEHGTMVQCDKCQVWLHSECVGLTEDALDELFYCGKCKESPKQQQQVSFIHTPTEQQEETMSSQDQINHHLHELFCQTPTEDGEEEGDEEDVFSMAIDDNSEALHVWDDFSFSSTLEKSNNDHWNLMEEDYENDHPSSSWTINDIGMFGGQPPSLLFSDPMSSTLDDVNTPVALSESTPTNINQDSTTTPLPLTETTPNSICEASSVCDATTPAMNSHTPIHTADGLWFQFANFDDDYQCET